MRILWHGDAAVHTGFGRVTQEFGERLISRGHEIHALAINWRGDPEVETRIKLYMPNYFDRNDIYGFNRLGPLIQKIQPDVFVLYNDLPIAQAILENLWRLPACPPVFLYFPVDAVNLPDFWLIPIRRSTVSATFTRWARNELIQRDPTLPEIAVIPHGVDFNAFYPIGPNRPGKVMLSDGSSLDVQSRQEARAIMGVADRFVVLWSDRNSPRKNIPQFFEAMAPLIQEHKDILLWVHCKPQDEGGFIEYWIDRHGLQRNVRITHGLDTWIGVPEYHLNAIYNISDVRVSTALGEGFGLHGPEAAATRLAQVAPSFTCFPEVLGDGALYVDPAYPYATQRGVDLAFPSVGQITDAVRTLYNDEVQRRRLGNAGYRHVQQFDWEKLTDSFEGCLKQTAETPFSPLVTV